MLHTYPIHLHYTPHASLYIVVGKWSLHFKRTSRQRASALDAISCWNMRHESCSFNPRHHIEWGQSGIHDETFLRTHAPLTDASWTFDVISSLTCYFAVSRRPGLEETKGFIPGRKSRYSPLYLDEVIDSIRVSHQAKWTTDSQKTT